MFKESENADDACHYHPGPSQTFIRNQNHCEEHLCMIDLTHTEAQTELVYDQSEFEGAVRN